jgi:hypothetical protein
MTGLKYCHFQFGVELGQLIGGENAAGACTDNYYIIIHNITPWSSKQYLVIIGVIIKKLRPPNGDLS